LSIMGTQASAITFLSGPGQAFADGMRFVQYYFGLPLAMVVICITFVPIFNKLKVYTAYEFLQNRFDTKTRTFTSFLFLLQRGLSTGISIYAPSIIVSSLFGWDVFWVNIVMGGMLIIYTVSGGARSVAHTQKIQLIIIFSAMTAAACMVVYLLPAGVGFTDALHISGKAGRTNVITTGMTENGFNWNDRYNIWSGIIGGFFLALSYFGTDHSQVGRYLTAQNNRESRLGLLMNGLVKVPMQFGILLIGVLVFAFYQFAPSPISFNEGLLNEINATSYKDSVVQLQKQYDSVTAQKKETALRYTEMRKAGIETDTVVQRFQALNEQGQEYRKAFREISQKAVSKSGEDANFVFLSFVKNYLPQGLKGLLIAIIFLAAWGSIAAALNSLAASTVVDFHQRFGKQQSESQEYKMAKWYTLGWGIFCVLVAEFAHNLGQSLIETVNILGSLFYGVILGIFLVAFYLKKVKGTATFLAAIVMELFIIALFFKNDLPLVSGLPDISFLWLNAIGAIGVVLLALLLQLFMKNRPSEMLGNDH
ncbi:MAG TPA: sodium:solute symporter, partial [Flavisolibacter sp.]